MSGTTIFDKHHLRRTSVVIGSTDFEIERNYSGDGNNCGSGRYILGASRGRDRGREKDNAGSRAPTPESIAPEASASRIAKGELTKQHVLDLRGPTRPPTAIHNDEPYVQNLAFVDGRRENHWWSSCSASANPHPPSPCRPPSSPPNPNCPISHT